MRAGGSFSLGLCLVLLSTLAPAAAAQPTIEVVDAPDVVIANPSENMTGDNFNPDHVFTSTVRVTNDGDDRQITTDAIFYTDPSVDGCPRDERSFIVSFITKTRTLDPSEQITIGGAAHPSQARGDAYWPMAISQAYYSGATNETIRVDADTYTFCTNIRVTGDDPDCEKPRDQTCVLATDSFRAYVRRSNAVPEITTFDIGDTTPRPGQQIIFEAEATDADTEPSPDTLTYTWNLAGTEKTGKVVRHSFDVATTHRVTLTVTDGFDEVSRSTMINVTTSRTGGQDGGDGGQAAPGPGLAVLAPVAMAALLLARRRP